MTSQPDQTVADAPSKAGSRWVLCDHGQELKLVGKDGEVLATISRWSDSFDSSMFWAGEGPDPRKNHLGIYETFASACRSVAKAVGVDIEPPDDLLGEWGDDELPAAVAPESAEQPAKIDTVVEAVRADLLKRSQVGIAKYGVTLDREDLSLRDWLQHAYEETLDQANYLKRAIIAMDGLGGHP